MLDLNVILAQRPRTHEPWSRGREHRSSVRPSATSLSQRQSLTVDCDASVDAGVAVRRLPARGPNCLTRFIPAAYSAKPANSFVALGMPSCHAASLVETAARVTLNCGMPLQIPAHLKDRFDALERLPLSVALPAPWKGPTYSAVGGLTDVGFADATDFLICMSADGLGVFDCLTGERVARDRDSNFAFDTGNLLVDGIGPLEGQRIRTAGLAGGGLAACTHDGWGVERHPFAFPNAELFVGPPRESMFSTQRGKEVQLSKLGGFVTELRAYGFSPTGRSFVIATSSDLMMFARRE